MVTSYLGELTTDWLSEEGFRSRLSRFERDLTHSIQYYADNREADLKHTLRWKASDAEAARSRSYDVAFRALVDSWKPDEETKVRDYDQPITVSRRVRLGIMLIACTAAALGGRITSALWFALYISGLAKGKKISLPRRMEKEVIAAIHNNRSYDTWRTTWDSIRPNGDSCKDSRAQADLYTCVGTFRARALEDGSVEYEDDYDWHHWSWTFSLNFGDLPINVGISGKDEGMIGFGRSFTTHGIIPAENVRSFLGDEPEKLAAYDKWVDEILLAPKAGVSTDDVLGPPDVW